MASLYPHPLSLDLEVPQQEVEFNFPFLESGLPS